MAEPLLLLREGSVSLKMCKGEQCTGDGNTLRFPSQERLKLVTLLRHSCAVVLSWNSWKGTGIFVCLPGNKFMTVKLITEFSRNNLSVWTDSVFHFDIHLTFSFLHVLRVLHHLPEKKTCSGSVGSLFHFCLLPPWKGLPRRDLRIACLACATGGRITCLQKAAMFSLATNSLSTSVYESCVDRWSNGA